MRAQEVRNGVTQSSYLGYSWVSERGNFTGGAA